MREWGRCERGLKGRVINEGRATASTLTDSPCTPRKEESLGLSMKSTDEAIDSLLQHTVAVLLSCRVCVGVSVCVRVCACVCVLTVQFYGFGSGFPHEVCVAGGGGAAGVRVSLLVYMCACACSCAFQATIEYLVYPT